MSWVFCPHNDIYIWIWQINSVNSRDFGPGTWWDASSAFSLGSQIPKPKPKLLYGSSFSGSFPTGATAPVYRPWVRPLIPNLPPQQLRYFCIHRLVDPENIRSLTVAQLILCASALSDPQFIFFLIFLLLYLVINCYVYGAGKWAKHEFTVLLDWIFFRSMQWNSSRQIQGELSNAPW